MTTSHPPLHSPSLLSPNYTYVTPRSLSRHPTPQCPPGALTCPVEDRAVCPIITLGDFPWEPLWAIRPTTDDRSERSPCLSTWVSGDMWGCRVTCGWCHVMSCRQACAQGSKLPEHDQVGSRQESEGKPPQEVCCVVSSSVWWRRVVQPC